MPYKIFDKSPDALSTGTLEHVGFYNNIDMVLVLEILGGGDETQTIAFENPIRLTVNWDSYAGDEAPLPHIQTKTQLGYVEYTYTYSQPGIYYVNISGNAQIYYGLYDDNLIEVISFGNLGLTSLSFAFVGSTKLTKVSQTLPSTVTDISYLFSSSNFNGPLNWNTSNVTNMDGVFQNNEFFNQSLNKWNTSNVTTMNQMFYNAILFNQPLNKWDTSNVTNMDSMFYQAQDFNYDIGSWNTKNVTNMDAMFAYATSFNQDLSKWCVTNIPSLPNDFDTGASSWILSEPIWGTCPE